MAGWIMSFFFFQAEDGIRDKLVTGVQTCALPISLPFLPETVRLVRDGATKGLVAVQVLDLALRRPERIAAFLKANRHVDVEAARALLEPHLGDAGVDEDVAQGANVVLGFVGGAHVRIADDLEERDAGAVEVHERVSPSAILPMLQRSGVFRERRAPDPHTLPAPQLQPAVHRQGQVVLRDLIPLRQIGIHVVLAVELGVMGRLAVQREPRRDRELDRATVRHGQRTGKSKADWANERVRRRTEPARLAAAEHLRLGVELDVGLDPDDELVRCGAHGTAGAEVRSGETMRRLRLTITRSSLTDTRYRSRPREAPSLELPRVSNVKNSPRPSRVQTAW